jgi:membrane-bound lytic murein transglycosylase MltF
VVAEFIGHNRRDMETLTDTSIAMLNRRLVLSINNIDAGYVAEAEMIGEKKELDPDSCHALQQTLPLLCYRNYYQRLDMVIAAEPNRCAMSIGS